MKKKKQVQHIGMMRIDPIPTLFIQDEMHLVKESLGTFDSHYESFLNYYAKTKTTLMFPIIRDFFVKKLEVIFFLNSRFYINDICVRQQYNH